MPQFNAEIGLKVNSTPAERQIRKVEKAVGKVERASRDILGVDKQIVGERKKLLRLSGEQATRAKKRITNLRLQRTELGLQRRELQGIVRLEKNRAKQVSGGSSGGGDGVNPVLLGAGAAAAARMSPANAFKLGDLSRDLKLRKEKLEDGLDAVNDEVVEQTAKIKASIAKYNATVQKFGAGSPQARMSRNVGIRSKSQGLRDAQFSQIVGRSRLQDVNTALEATNKAQSKLTRTATKAASPINALGKQLLITAGAYATLDTAIRAVNASARSTAEIQRLEIALKAIVGADTPKALKAIERAVQDFNIPLQNATKNFTQLAAAGLANGNSVEELETLYRGLAAATKATGGNAEDLNGVLRAATQVLSKSKVQAEELRGQIGDRLPGAFQLFAEATGRTAKELDKALEQGEVSAEEFVTKFGKFIKEKYEPAAKKIGSSPAEAGARLQKELDNLNRGIGPALAEIGAKFQDFSSSVLKALTPIAEELARIFNIGQNNNLRAYKESLSQLARLDGEITKTEKRLSDAQVAGQSDFALLGIQENLKSLNDRRQRLLKKIALQNASLGVNESTPRTPRAEDDTDLTTIRDTFRDAADSAADLEEARRIALRDQDQLLERLELQIILENSATDQERLINQLLLDQLEIRQNINNKLADSDPLLAGLIKREAFLRNELAQGEALGGLFEGAGFNMGAALAEGLPEAKTELTEVEQLVNNIGSTITDGLVEALTLAVTETDKLAESMQQLASDILMTIGKMMILNAVKAGLSALDGGDGVGLFSILNGNFGQRANGGPVVPNQPYLVGERGPEIVVPQAAGTVLSNEDSRAAMDRYSTATAGPTTVNYSGPVLSFNGDEYLPKSAVPGIIQAAASQGAKSGNAMTMNVLKNSRSQRSSLGL